MFIEIDIRAESSPETRQILEGINRGLREMHELKEVIHTMTTTAVTRDQFDQALKDGIAKIVGKIDDLAAKVAAGTITTPEDFSAELAILQTGVSEALAKDPDPPATT